jgi:hypothetical protein
MAIAPSAWGATVNVNVVAQVAYIGATGSGFHWAGTVTDPALGDGGLTATLRLVRSGYVGNATILNSSGSLTGSVTATLRQRGQLVHFGLTADITAASGRFAGARGTLTGTALVTATLADGHLRLHGTLHGASGRAPAPLGGARVRHVDGRFLGAELSLARDRVLTVVGSATGLVPGPAVLVARGRETTTGSRGMITLFTAGGTLSGVYNVRFPGSGPLRSETGTWTITRGSGEESGAHGPIALRGTRNLRLELIALRIRGALTL